jgi:hypothetical protein
MTQPLFVDTGGWVAYFDKSDNAHVMFKDYLSLVIRGTAWLLHTSTTSSTKPSRSSVITSAMPRLALRWIIFVIWRLPGY